MPWPAGPITSAAVRVPSTVADSPGAGCGHAGVPAGPLPRLLQKKTEMPPLTSFCPKWMCDCVTGLSSAR